MVICIKYCQFTEPNRGGGALMKMKVSISSSLFLLLFLSFWQLDQREEREYSLFIHDKEMEEIIPISNELEKVFQNKIEAFQSREYVRVSKVL